MRLCLALLTLLALLPSSAAQPPQPPEETHLITMDVKRVVLYATVREGKARFVSDLAREHFTVLEDGVRQEILSFSRDDVPVAIGLLVDNSQSMMNKRDEVIAAAKAFVAATRPNDQLFILHFNETLAFGLPPDQPFSSDPALLGAALDRVRLDGRTALYDAIQLGLKHLATSNLTKKALIVLSDGGDNMSRGKPEEVVRSADLSGALFYGIGIYDAMDGDANPGVLRKLAHSTGGEAWFPKDLQEVKGLCEGIARDLRSQYMLSYSPREQTAKPDYRKIQVKVKDPAGRRLIVRTRTGYYASAQKETSAR
jgi:VWFA-related protein